ncbi:uncharacterized protein BCR38DRAFT_195216 [Pseudomassariella vexata]|uniref:Uncharacterized protein n=1 Tax=Pseudomassariella vexata TaxID=1141098 RepID=A0A1Y2E1E3_9PEZI|nr:uncharacterized protein BCR38DRAFT_195216 [Pseudomassariella vexata]ORY65319.1 hypothetical protein BCR38DRAFT_195216 [Pseudomassariella vexata]
MSRLTFPRHGTVSQDCCGLLLMFVLSFFFGSLQNGATKPCQASVDTTAGRSMTSANSPGRLTQAVENPNKVTPSIVAYKC